MRCFCALPDPADQGTDPLVPLPSSRAPARPRSRRRRRLRACCGTPPSPVFDGVFWVPVVRGVFVCVFSFIFLSQAVSKCAHRGRLVAGGKGEELPPRRQGDVG